MNSCEAHRLKKGYSKVHGVACATMLQPDLRVVVSLGAPRETNRLSARFSCLGVVMANAATLCGLDCQLDCLSYTL